jgi:hypothetical protein
LKVKSTPQFLKQPATLASGCGGGNYDTFSSPSLSVNLKQHSDTFVFASEKSLKVTYSLLIQLNYVNDEEYKHSTGTVRVAGRFPAGEPVAGEGSSSSS